MAPNVLSTLTKEEAAHDWPIIEPKFWTGKTVVDRTDYVIDCGSYNMTGETPDPELAKRMIETFDKTGLVLLTNTGLTDMQAMRRNANVVITQQMQYKGGANSRLAINDNVYDTGAPKEAWLHYHHEMAYVNQSTKVLGFCCAAATPGKGETFVSDNTKVTEHLLKSKFGMKLREKGLCYWRDLTDREFYKGKEENKVYNHWQRSFGVETQEEVEVLAKERGLQVEWGADPNNRFCRTKFYISAFEYFPQTDKNLLYSSVADDAMWFDTWPGICEDHPTDRPLKLTFGDGEEMTQEEFSQFVDVYDQFGIPIQWNVGDVAIVCNFRFAHGRPRYALHEGEQRELGVVLGETFTRVGDLPDKW